MANIDNKSLEPVKPLKVDGKIEASPNSTTNALVKKIDDVGHQVSLLEQIMMVIIIALVLALLAQVFTYFTMTRDAFIEYKQSVNEFNNDRHNSISERIDKLESATVSSTPKK